MMSVNKTMPNCIDWEKCQQDFDFDGSWRDIYILNTDCNDWGKLLNFLLDSHYKITFGVDGEISRLISTIQQALKIRNIASPLMHIDADGILIACHFFTDEKIEFDIDPREINNQKDLNKVIDFMISIGNVLRKNAILTPENCQLYGSKMQILAMVNLGGS